MPSVECDCGRLVTLDIPGLAKPRILFSALASHPQKEIKMFNRSNKFNPKLVSLCLFQLFWGSYEIH